MAVIIPSFARGPGSASIISAVNVDNLSTPIAAAAADGLSESGGTVTVTTTVQHDLVAGDPVTISGGEHAGYNGTFTVRSRARQHDLHLHRRDHRPGHCRRWNGLAGPRHPDFAQRADHRRDDRASSR